METKQLTLVPMTRDEVLAMVQAMRPEDRAQVSPVWLAQVQASPLIDPWQHGFNLVHRLTGQTVGQCMFKGPPDNEGVVEIAYGIAPEHQGNGYATEAAAALVLFAFNHPTVRVVRAHTLPHPSASTRVLTKCGFRHTGEVVDPEDGPVWRWEKYPA